ncbi:MAG: 3-oxoacyl-[acyl-carrier-protein] reductase [Azospirillaceae bacterium]
MLDLTGKTALVTGASGDIGRAIATALHGRGATVALSGTREAKLQEVATSLGGERVHVTPGNLADADATAALFAAAEAAMGQVDILVNNAGMTRDNLSMRMKDEDFTAVLEVNLTAAFRLCRAAMKGMMRRRWGRIVSITSVVGFTGNPGQANYAASKAGLVGMTKSIAAEVANRGITVNCVAPGFIRSAMTDVLTDDQKARITAVIPAGRMGSADDIAAGVAYLASEEAAYVTGQTLHINGGMAML